MKKNYYFIIVLFGALTFAQTTITKAANDYIVGDAVNQFNLVGTPDNSATGSNVTFYNAALTNGSAITSTIAAPSAGEITTFPNSNIKFSDGNGNDLYYKTSTSSLEITGATIGSVVLNFSTNNALLINFPTSFGNTHNDIAQGTATFSSYTLVLRGTIATTADATGTLLLGTQTYSNILRLKTVQNYNLYLPIDTNPIGTFTSTIYAYYDNVKRYPIFTTTAATVVVPLASINQSINTSVGLSTVVLAANDSSTKNKIRVYPNPVQSDLFIAGDLGNYSEVKVYSLDGKLVKTGKISDKKLDVSKLSAGNYLLELSSKTEKSKTTHILKN